MDFYTPAYYGGTHSTRSTDQSGTYLKRHFAKMGLLFQLVNPCSYSATAIKLRLLDTLHNSKKDEQILRSSRNTV